MKLKKLLAIGALVPALLLAGCAGNPTPEPTPSATETSRPSDTPENPESAGSWDVGQLRAYTYTPQYYETASFYGDKIEFTPDENLVGGDTAQVVTAVWTVNQYIKTAFDSGYFLAGWWESKDDFSQAGIEQVSKFATPSFQKEFSAYASAVSKNDNAEALAWLSPRVFLPSTQPDYMMFETCAEDWVLNACRAEEPAISSYKATRDRSGNVKVQVDVKVTPAYNQVIDGAPGVEPRTYHLTFQLAPDMEALPKILSEEEAVELQTKLADGYKFTEEDYEPYPYRIYGLEATLEVGAPYAI
jgi:hypothetical protein